MFSVYSTSSSASVSVFCGKHSTEQLTTILGRNYNTKLMAIEVLDKKYEEISRSRKEWLIMHLQNTTELAEDDVDSKRSFEMLKHIYENMEQNYECGSYTKMIDLGPNYFPRYIFSISCKSSQCFHKAETIKLLRRHTGRPNPCGHTWWWIHSHEISEFWVWEEFLINSGCE